MRTFNHTNQKSFIHPQIPFNQDKSFTLKIICDDGVIFCDRLVFILWSHKLRKLLDPWEEITVLIFPGVHKRTMELLLELLRKGNVSGN